MSDAQLKQGVTELVKARHIAGLQSLHVEANNGVVTLEGTVESPFAHWACCECARHVTGVLRVIDRLQIVAS